MITAVELHASAEPGCVIVLDVPGPSMFEKMTHLRDHGDELRRRFTPALVWAGAAPTTLTPPVGVS
jgi:hypothetical protein